MNPAITQTDGGVLFVHAPAVLDEKTKSALLDKWGTGDEDGDGEILALIEKCESVASPKGFLRPAEVTFLSAKEKRAVIGGVSFYGSLLPDKLHSVYESESPTVYPFTVTCGMELHQLSQTEPDLFLRGIIDDVSVAYMRLAGATMREYVQENYFKGRHFSTLNPGSLKQWNLKNQVPLLELLGGGRKTGVRLTDSCLMVPFKSGSGIYFETEHSFESCMFCGKLDCPNRRAPFDKTLPED